MHLNKYLKNVILKAHQVICLHQGTRRPPSGSFAVAGWKHLEVFLVVAKPLQLWRCAAAPLWSYLVAAPKRAPKSVWLSSALATTATTSSPWGRGREESNMTERLPFHFSLFALVKEMATHSSVLAWRIPGMGSQSWTQLKWLSSSSSSNHHQCSHF